MTTTLTIDGTERTFTHADTVSVSVHNGAAHASCTSCRRGEYLPRGIKHSSRCGDDNGQAVEMAAAPVAPAISRPSSHADARAIHAAAKAGIEAKMSSSMAEPPSAPCLFSRRPSCQVPLTVHRR
jgi:hypothetical protein